MTESEAPSGERLSSPWLRYSAYTVSKTPLLMIRPAATATLELYDPWEADRAAQGEEQRPYKQLLRMAQRTNLGAARFDMPKRERQQLEQWVRHNGLLGILPHETLFYRNAPHWHETPIELEFSDSKKRGVRKLTPYQVEVRRVSGDWSLTYHRVGDEHPLRTARRGDPVDPAMLYDSAKAAEVTYRSWPRGDVVRASLGRRFKTFFPARSRQEVEQREYASPASSRFWADYGEPLGLLLRYGWHLANALTAFSVWPPTEPWQERNAILALQQLNDAAIGASLVGRLEENGAVRLEWSGTSLLGCFATMILEDLAGGQRAMRCPVCRGVFLSSAHQAKFCSSTCRYTYHKREQRRRDAEREENS